MRIYMGKRPLLSAICFGASGVFVLLSILSGLGEHHANSTLHRWVVGLGIPWAALNMAIACAYLCAFVAEKKEARQ